MAGDSASSPRPKPDSLYGRFKAAAKALKQECLALYYAVHDPRTPLVAKVLPWMVLAYALSPLDLIPDFIPILGLLDDLLLLPGLIWLAIHLIPKEVMADSRLRAEAEPLRLSRNWFVAVVISLLWLAGLEYCLYLGIDTWGTPEVQQYQWHIMGAVAGVSVLAFAWWLSSALRKEARKQAAAGGGKAEGKAKKGGRGKAPPPCCSIDVEAGQDEGEGGLQQPLLSPVEESPYSGLDSPISASVLAAAGTSGAKVSSSGSSAHPGPRPEDS